MRFTPAQRAVAGADASRQKVFQLLNAAQPVDLTEVRIPCQQRSAVIDSAGGDPQVIGRDRLALALLTRIDKLMAVGRLCRDRHDIDTRRIDEVRQNRRANRDG